MIKEIVDKLRDKSAIVNVIYRNCEHNNIDPYSHIAINEYLVQLYKRNESLEKLIFEFFDKFTHDSLEGTIRKFRGGLSILPPSCDHTNVEYIKEHVMAYCLDCHCNIMRPKTQENNHAG